MKNSKLKKALAGVSSLCVLASSIPCCAAFAADTASNYPYGDADLDGKVGISDVVKVMMYVGNKTENELTDEQLDRADVYNRGDGVFISDALSIQKKVAQILDTLPESSMDTPVESEAYIHLKNTTIETEGDNMTVEGSTVTITASGTYYIDGVLDDGQIIVNVPDEVADPETVKLFLNGVSITGLSAPAIYVANAENTSINLMEGTVNTLSDGTVAYTGDYLDNGIIEAKDDLTIKGTGTLEIYANTQYAIACNNDVKFTEGTVNITTVAADAVRGKTSVTVKETAVLNIDSAGDGIKSTQGNVAIEGGTISVKASNDAVQAETTIDISGGSLIAGGDRGLTGVTGVNITGGSVIATATDNQVDSTLLTATQGTMLLNCIDDATQTDGCWRKVNAVSVSGTSISTALTKKYKYVLISDASLTAGTEYTLTNTGTGATITHTNDASSSFALSGTVTSFDAVNPGGTSGTVVTPTEGYTITLSGSSVLTNAPTEVASVSDGVCTITQPGVFAVSGDMNEGQIVVNVDKTAYPEGVVELDLMGVNLTNTTDSPVYVASIGDEVQIVAKAGYENTISDGTSYTNADLGMGAIYSCDDLKIKGTGSLTVNGNCEDAVVCKNDLKIYNGNITINAVDDGVRGKDSVTIGNAADTDFSTLNLTVKSTAGDGIKSTATDAATADKSYGIVTINGGTVDVNTFGDGIQGEQDVVINGGDIKIFTYQGSSYTGSGSSSGSTRPGGGGMGMDGNSNKMPTDLSAKGIKAVGLYDTTGTTYQSGGNIVINGGTIDVNSSDDCVHAGGNIDLVGGAMTLASADDGVHSDNTLTIGHGSGTFDDLSVAVSTCYEGMEGEVITQNSGTVIVNSTDDGYNAAGGDGSGSTSPGGWGGNMGGSSSNAAINLKGGFVLVNVTDGDHDGFDSNGSLTVSGAIAITNGNGPFDCESLSCTSGIWIEDSNCSSYMDTQPSYSVSGGSVSKGERITLVGSNGNVLVSFIAGKNVTTLRAGGEVTGASFYTGGTLNGSTYFQTIDDTQLAAYGGTLSGGTQSTGSGSGNNPTNPWG